METKPRNSKIVKIKQINIKEHLDSTFTIKFKYRLGTSYCHNRL